MVDVACTAGTYVRALARDLGAAVGSAGYLGALRRTASGPFSLADAHPLDEVRAAAADERFADLLLPVGSGLDDLPALALADGELRVGRPRRLDRARRAPGRGGGGDGGRHGGPPARAVRVRSPPSRACQPDGRLVTDKVLLDREATRRRATRSTAAVDA